MTNNDYAGFEPALVNGYITGVRRFRVLETGELSGPQFKNTIKPGINTAQCRADEFLYNFGGGGYFMKKVHSTEPIASKRCTCGFYAYHDPNNNMYEYHNTIRAVVAGTGHVTCGSRGFRAEKIELLGYVNPLLPRDGEKAFWSTISNKIVKLDDALNRNMAFSFFAGVSLLITATLSALFASHIFDALCIAMFAVMLLRIVQMFYVLFLRGRSIYKNATDWDNMSIPWDKIKSNYPDAKVFRTTEEMLEEFPLWSRSDSA